MNNDGRSKPELFAACFKIPQFRASIEDMEDSEWVQRLRNGDPKAYSRFVDQFQGRVYNTCIGFVFNREDAEDLAQEVFVEVFRSIANFEERSSLATWVYRIAVTKSLELLRSRTRKKRAGQLLSLFGLQQSGFDVRGHAIDHPGIRLENQERAKHLYAAIDSLPENQRIAFVLHKIDGHSYEAVAEIMELSGPSVESLLFRAKKNLQKKLENYYRST
jgi:RNA polymerase sigma factor (sigma-70 family)